MNEVQSRKFLDGAADDYYRRNKADFGKMDLVSPLLEQVGLRPQDVLEVGCANGWRLDKLQRQYDCRVYGIEPSQAAIDEQLVGPIVKGTADSLPYEEMSFDLVIIGFCLWLIEPHQWLRVAAEADRVLKNGGALIVHDYASLYPMRWEGWCEQFGGDHEKGTVAWFYDFPKLWLGHPCYSTVTREVAARRFGEMFVLEQAMLLRKSYAAFLAVKPEAVV